MSNELLLRNWEKKSKDRQKLYTKFLGRANKNDTLRLLPALHEEAFSHINCLDCANCCKNYSPRFNTTDIKRISKHLNLKTGDFINNFLRMDEEEDYVLQSKPCTFLGEDNFCSIYEVRPKDCMRFPYTDEDVFVKKPKITQKNSSFCPAVYFVLEKFIEKK